MAYKVFSNGDALTGSELNTYLMNQSVMVFASTTARDAALTAPTEGMVVWLQDANKYVYYTGSAWADLIVPAPTGNAILNSGMDIWQRATAQTAAGYGLDRWHTNTYGTSWNSLSVTRQSSGAPTGFRYYMRVAAGSATATNIFVSQSLETSDVVKLAGQTVTLSFYYRVNTNFSAAWTVLPVYSTNTDEKLDVPNGTAIGSSQTITNTTSWTRFTYSFSIPSTATSFALQFSNGNNTVATGSFDLTGVQLEAGSSATAFKRNAPSIGLEQTDTERYLAAKGGDKLYEQYGFGSATSTTAAKIWIPFGTTTRVAPTSVEYSLPMVLSDGAATIAVTSITLNESTKQGCTIVVNVASGLTQFRPYLLMANNSLASYLRFPAEL